MNMPTISRSETTATTSPVDAAALAEPGARRRVRPRTLAGMLLTTFVVALGACQGEAGPSQQSGENPSLGNAEQDLSAGACRQDLGGCLATASGASDLGQCTLDFEDCFSQAALDGVGQGKLLAQCRATADGCLSAAVNAGDIRACGDVLGDCADDAVARPRGLFGLLTPIVSRVLKVTGHSVRGVIDIVDGVPAIALSSVRTCRDQVGQCLDHAVSDLDIRSCADGLDVCVGGVVDILDPALAPLPGPSPSDVLTATADCRTDAKDCVSAALSLKDIRVCGDVLGTCVDDATALIDDTVDDVNDIVDPLAVPKPSNAVDCTLELAKCLADLNNPFDCADQAEVCATH